MKIKVFLIATFLFCICHAKHANATAKRRMVKPTAEELEAFKCQQKFSKRVTADLYAQETVILPILPIVKLEAMMKGMQIKAQKAETIEHKACLIVEPMKSGLQLNRFAEQARQYGVKDVVYSPYLLGNSNLGHGYSAVFLPKIATIALTPMEILQGEPSAAMSRALKLAELAQMRVNGFDSSFNVNFNLKLDEELNFLKLELKTFSSDWLAAFPKWLQSLNSFDDTSKGEVASFMKLLSAGIQELTTARNVLKKFHQIAEIYQIAPKIYANYFVGARPQYGVSIDSGDAIIDVFMINHVERPVFEELYNKSNIRVNVKLTSFQVDLIDQRLARTEKFYLAFRTKLRELRELLKNSDINREAVDLIASELSNMVDLDFKD